MSKVLGYYLQSFVALENPNITVVSLDPGFADRDILLDAYKSVHHSAFELIGRAGVWLTADNAKFLIGRYFNVTWDVNELLVRKFEVVKENKLLRWTVGEGTV